VTTQAFSWISATEQANMQLLDMSQRPYYLLFCLQRWLTLILDLVTVGLTTLLIGLAVALQDRIDAGYLGVALVSVMTFGQPVSTLIVQWTNLETSLGAVSRIKTHLEALPGDYEDQHPSTEPDQNNRNIPADWPSRGELTISKLSASYGNHKVLNDINLSIRPGSRVAICG
jgi:ABC-type multidrug transport system fused ATPase/permease subunit